MGNTNLIVSFQMKTKFNIILKDDFFKKVDVSYTYFRQVISELLIF